MYKQKIIYIVQRSIISHKKATEDRESAGRSVVRTPRFRRRGRKLHSWGRLRSHKPCSHSKKKEEKNQVLTHDTISMNLKNTLNETSRTQKATYYMISLTGNIHDKRDKNRFVLARDLGKGEIDNAY